MKSLIRNGTVILPVVLAAACQSGGGGGRSMFSSRPTEDWTILCYEFNAEPHRNHCEQVADTLRRTPDIRADEVWCAHDDVSLISRLYYGRYRISVDPQSRSPQVPEGMRRDFELVCTLGDDQQRRLFGQARMVPMVDAPQAEHTEWALIRAKGTFSLQVAVFQADSEFSQPRQAAVELVEELRKEGHEAYYHHGTVMSMVTVGTFGPGATMKSSEVATVRRSDPRFEHNYINGQVRTTIVNGLRVPSQSFLVRIPEWDRTEALP